MPQGGVPGLPDQCEDGRGVECAAGGDGGAGVGGDRALGRRQVEPAERPPPRPGAAHRRAERQGTAGSQHHGLRAHGAVRGRVPGGHPRVQRGRVVGDRAAGAGQLLPGISAVHRRVPVPGLPARQRAGVPDPGGGGGRRDRARPPGELPAAAGGDGSGAGGVGVGARQASGSSGRHPGLPPWPSCGRRTPAGRCPRGWPCR